MLNALSTVHRRNFHGKLSILFILLLILFLIKDYKIQQLLPFKEQNLIQYVNPFIGTTNGGLTFPGAVYPFGMVAWSPDTNSKSYSGGYEYKDNQIMDFSLTHYSGGGLGTAQDVPIMPYVGQLNTSPSSNPSIYYSHFSHKNEVAKPGYYYTYLEDPKVKVELTTTPRTGFGKFTFPSSNQSTLLINNLGNAYGYGHAYGGTNTAPSGVNIINSKELTGFTQEWPGHPLYFYAIFDKPFIKHGMYTSSSILTNVSSISGTDSGAFVVFDTTKDRIIQMRVGISYVSISNAKANLQTENPNWDFSSIKQKVDIAWNKMLNKIQIEANQNQKNIFYTALYHAFLHPNIFSDINGEYMGFDNKVHRLEQGHTQYQYFSNWDIYRDQIQLLAILDPNRTSDMMQSLVNDAKQRNGTIPIWEAKNVDRGIMGGDSGIPVIASAYAFGATKFDIPAAIAAMTNLGSKVNNETFEKQGYISNEDTWRSASETLEYSTDSFSIAAFTSLTGNETICSKYLPFSQNWQNLLNAKTGDIQPRNKKGEWNENFSPLDPAGFEEGSSAGYSWMIPHDLPKLISLMGGKEKAIFKLDQSFSKYGINLGNEPTFISPWVYTFAGAPDKTQEIVRNLLTTSFSNTPGGLPGNDDSGATSSWYIFSSMGLYPAVPGVGGFVIGTPLFKSTTIQFDNNKQINITSNPSPQNSIYIKGLNINNQTYTSSWISWNKIKNGATLKFDLASSPSAWGTKNADLPPVFTSSSICKESFSSSLLHLIQKIIPFLIQQLHK